MIYIDKPYLITHCFERFIDESSQDDPEIIGNTIAAKIALIKTLLSTRYNVDLIFDETDPVENEVLKEILAKLVIESLVRRNAARKVPTDYKDNYKWAMETLEKLSTGKIILGDLPTPVDENGNPSPSNSIWGNSKNQNNYI